MVTLPTEQGFILPTDRTFATNFLSWSHAHVFFATTFDLSMHADELAFPSTYFYAHFRISHKKTLDGNGKMRIHSKNAQKKHITHIWIG